MGDTDTMKRTMTHAELGKLNKENRLREIERRKKEWVTVAHLQEMLSGFPGDMLVAIADYEYGGLHAPVLRYRTLEQIAGWTNVEPFNRYDNQEIVEIR